MKRIAMTATLLSLAACGQQGITFAADPCVQRIGQGFAWDFNFGFTLQNHGPEAVATINIETDTGERWLALVGVKTDALFQKIESDFPTHNNPSTFTFSLQSSALASDVKGTDQRTVTYAGTSDGMSCKSATAIPGE